MAVTTNRGQILLEDIGVDICAGDGCPNRRYFGETATFQKRSHLAPQRSAIAAPMTSEEQKRTRITKLFSILLNLYEIYTKQSSFVAISVCASLLIVALQYSAARALHI